MGLHPSLGQPFVQRELLLSKKKVDGTSILGARTFFFREFSWVREPTEKGHMAHSARPGGGLRPGRRRRLPGPGTAPFGAVVFWWERTHRTNEPGSLSTELRHL